MAGKRMIHDNALRSKKLNSVSTGAGELWFRILLLVDDNGNYFGDRLVIYANAMRSKKGVTANHVDKYVDELINVGLLEQYAVPEEDEPYIHVANFHDYQFFKTDRPVKVTYPIHPEGPYFTATGKVPLLVRDGGVKDTTSVQSGSTAVPSVNPEVELEVEAKGEVSVKGERLVRSDFSEDEPVEDLGDWSSFVKDFHREAGGVKTFKNFETNHEKYQGLCRQYGSDAVHEVIAEWVKLKGGKAVTKQNQFAAKNFLEEADGLLEDRKNGASEAEAESDEIARVARPRGVREEMMR